MLETKRFIGNDMPRLYERIRNELGPDAVIVRTRSLLRENAEPLIEVLAAAAEVQPEVSLDLQWQMIDGALGRLQISRPRATVGDLEDMVARDDALALPAGAVRSPIARLAGSDGALSSRAPDDGEPSPAFEHGVFEEPGIRRAAPVPEPEFETPAPFQPRPRPGLTRPAGTKPGEAPPAGPGDGIRSALVRAGFGEAAVERMLRGSPGESAPALALARCLESGNLRYPDEKQTALITMRGMVASGRTTALIRMALDCSESGRHAVLLAADSAHAGAREQLHGYADAIGIEAADAFDAHELVRQITRQKRGTCIFADIPPGDWRAPALAGVEPLSYLVVPAHWQPGALERGLTPLPTASFAGAVLSFSDLATNLVPALSLIIDSHLALAFLSSGRDVSTGIEIADPLTLASGIFATRTGERADGHLVASA
jgi:hypothetical protein